MIGTVKLESNGVTLILSDLTAENLSPGQFLLVFTI